MASGNGLPHSPRRRLVLQGRGGGTKAQEVLRLVLPGVRVGWGLQEECGACPQTMGTWMCWCVRV